MKTGKRARGNPFGIAEAVLGLVIGFALSILAVSAYASIEHVSPSRTTVGEDVVSLVTLWIGFVGAVVVATRNAPGKPARADEAEADEAPAGERDRATGGPHGTGSVVTDFGLYLRPLVDIPLGIVAGVASQFLLVPLLELPLMPFVSHLNERLGHPTKQLLGPASSSGTGGLVLIAVLVCVGSPLVEELFFRGLVLRALLWQFRRVGPGQAAAASIVLTGLLFGLAHFEALQFLGLAGFGMVLGVLAWRTGRLGPSIVAHMAFNTSTVVAYAFFVH